MKRILNQVEERLSAGIFIVMLAITFGNVIGRYFFHASISFTEEITTNLFVLVSVIGTAIAARDRAHLGLSAFTELLPKKAQRAVSAFGNLMGTAFGAVLFVTGLQMVQTQLAIGAKTTTLMWPAWIFGLFLPFGGILIFLRFGWAAISDFRSLGSAGDLQKGGEVDGL